MQKNPKKYHALQFNLELKQLDVHFMYIHINNQVWEDLNKCNCLQNCVKTSEHSFRRMFVVWKNLCSFTVLMLLYNFLTKIWGVKT